MVKVFYGRVVDFEYVVLVEFHNCHQYHLSSEESVADSIDLMADPLVSVILQQGMGAFEVQKTEVWVKDYML